MERLENWFLRHSRAAVNTTIHNEGKEYEDYLMFPEVRISICRAGRVAPAGCYAGIGCSTQSLGLY